MPELFSTFQYAILEVLPMTAIMQDIDACVFDAYGTLFEFAAAVFGVLGALDFGVL